MNKLNNLNKIMKLFGIILTAALCWGGFLEMSRAEVRLPRGVFTDHAVLQREVPIHIWGWASPGEKIQAAFGEERGSTEAAPDGTFDVYLPPQKAAYRGKDLIVSGENEIVFHDIVVGEVWVCSGQSNMELPLSGRPSGTPEELYGDYSYIRFNRSQERVAPEPLADLPTPGWKLCADGKQGGCTAAGFHFAVRLHRELNVPVGLIDSSWGGSDISWWTPDFAWKDSPFCASFEDTAQKRREVFQKNLKAPYPPLGMTLEEYGNVTWELIGAMYNARIAPWTPYSIRGVIWFQCEHNHPDRESYAPKMRTLVHSWRKVWKNDRLPFYWVQAASLFPPQEDPNALGKWPMANWPALRDGQVLATDLPMTGIAIAVDIGEADNLHPANKFDVGNRLALLALDDVFGKVAEGHSPILEKMEIKDGKAYLTFAHVGGGLIIGKKTGREPMTPNPAGKLARFAIAGADRHFVWADAEITGSNTVTVSSPEVAEPAAVRYAWQVNPEGCNLYSKEGLPATPFRTDSWENDYGNPDDFEPYP